MRKRLIVALLMVFLSVAPAFAGHSVAGYGWCECDSPANHPLNVSIQNDKEDTQQDAISDLGLLFLVLTVLTLRYKG